MASPQANYVMQHSKKIAQLLREAGGGEIDQKIETLMARMERAHKCLDDITRRREWTRDQQELLTSAERFYNEAGNQADAINRAASRMSQYPGTSRQVTEIKRLMSKLTYVRMDLSRSLSALRDTKLPTAGFNHQELDPANLTGQIFTHYHGGLDGVKPATFQLTGPAGSTAAIKMEHMRDRLYGGHDHDIAPRHLGTLESVLPTNFQYDPEGGVANFALTGGGNAEIRCRPSDVCTRRKFTLRLNWESAGMGWMCYVDVRYINTLYDFYQYDLPYMEPYQGDSTHRNEDSHYCSLEMLEALEQLHRAYRRAYEAEEFHEQIEENGQTRSVPPTQPRLMINDISLPWGGTFKERGEFERDAHETHKWGNDVDIRWNDQTQKQRQWMWDNAPKYFKKVDTHAKNTPREHWHLDMD